MIHLLGEGFARPTGGIRRASFELHGALQRAGADVRVARWVDRTSLAGDGLGPNRRTRAARQVGESVSTLARRLGRRPGVNHGLYYDLALAVAPSPTVVTAYDMIHERFGEGGNGLPRAKRIAFNRADVIVCISHATATDVRELFPKAPDVRVIHLGVSDTILEADGPEPPVTRRHLLYVGRRSTYKNFALLLAAIEQCAELRSLPLVLAGGGPLTSAERTRLAQVLPDALVDHRPHVDERTLVELYDEAAVLVVPSLVEGFGLPVVEAMARGCPVACSDTPSLAEVAGGHGFLFDSSDATACADAIQRAIHSGTVHRHAATEYARRFSWDRVAREHLDLYTELQPGVGHREPLRSNR